MRPTSLRTPLALVALALVAGAAIAASPHGRGELLGATDGTMPRSVTLTAPPSILFGDTATLSAIAYDTKGRRVPRALITFSVSDTTIGHVPDGHTLLGVDEGGVVVTATWTNGKTIYARASQSVQIFCARKGIAREIMPGPTSQSLTHLFGVYSLHDALLNADVQDTARLAVPEVPGRHGMQLLRFCFPRQSRVVYHFESSRGVLADTIPRTHLDSVPVLPMHSSAAARTQV